MKHLHEETGGDGRGVGAEKRQDSWVSLFLLYCYASAEWSLV